MVIPTDSRRFTGRNRSLSASRSPISTSSQRPSPWSDRIQAQSQPMPSGWTVVGGCHPKLHRRSVGAVNLQAEYLRLRARTWGQAFDTNGKRIGDLVPVPNGTTAGNHVCGEAEMHRADLGGLGLRPGKSVRGDHGIRHQDRKTQCAAGGQ